MPILDFEEKSSQQIASEAAIEKRANSILIASAISILFCCIGGIVATYIAYNATQDVKAGDFDSASRRISYATGIMVASFVIGTLSLIGRLSQQGS